MTVQNLPYQNFYKHCKDFLMVLTERSTMHFRRSCISPQEEPVSTFNVAQLTKEQVDFNSSMSKVRVTADWMFAEVINNSKFIDFQKNLKTGLSCVGKFCRVIAILTNAHTCLYKNNVSQYFAIDPPMRNKTMYTHHSNDFVQI